MPMGTNIGAARRDTRAGRRAHAPVLRKAAWLCLAALLLGAGAARAGEIAVVVNPALTTAGLDLETIRKVFLGEKDYLGDIPLDPVDYRGDRALRDGFFHATLGMSCRAFDSYWVKEVFRSGHVPPIRVHGYEAMLEAVAADPGAVGYLPVERLKGVTSVREVLIVTTP